MKKKFALATLLPSFVSLNSFANDASSDDIKALAEPSPLDGFIIAPLNSATPLYLAAHRSHSSHSSHRSSSGGSSSGHTSHASHRSSTGGGFTTPAAPTTTPAQQSDPLGRPSKPAFTSPPKNTATSQQMMRLETIKRVQLTLNLLGYYNGAIDGVMGPGTRKALLAYRVDKTYPLKKGLTRNYSTHLAFQHNDAALLLHYWLSFLPFLVR